MFSYHDVAVAAYRILERCSRDHHYGWGGYGRVWRLEKGGGGGGQQRRVSGVVPVYVRNGGAGGGLGGLELVGGGYGLGGGNSTV